ncbi:MAG TPA: alpha/beta hydrolase [Blastocatellia bacterium]|nr:alpha/beta hydrolase [Blastocatellia bacterium]
MPHVFISHATGDDDFVRELRIALESLKIPVWVDSRNLRGGSKLNPEITRAIEDARQVIVVLSPNTVNSPWVRKEITKALEVERQFGVQASACGGESTYRVILIVPPGFDLAALQGWFDAEPSGMRVQIGPGGLREALPQIMATLEERLPDESWTEPERGSVSTGALFLSTETDQPPYRGGGGLDAGLNPPDLEPKDWLKIGGHVGSSAYDVCDLEPMSRAVSDPLYEADYPGATVHILYGTDRRRVYQTIPSNFYDYNRGTLETGLCVVSIPKRHTQGELERPKWWKFEFKPNPARHFVVLEVMPIKSDQFTATLQTMAAGSRLREAFVFVHGFNTTFDEAARRTAQLAYDLGFDGTNGIPFMYSWPSKGNVEDYLYDEESVIWSATNFQQFLLEIARAGRIDRFHLLAHSMGNRVLTEALGVISKLGWEERWPVFNQVVLAAPDIDAGIFMSRIVPVILGKSQGLTLYASSNDKALAASRRLRSGYPRAGESGSGIVLANGIETIDASDVRTDLLGHGYFADTAALINDLYHLMRHGLPPDQRNLRPREKDGLKYWAFPRLW